MREADLFQTEEEIIKKLNKALEKFRVGLEWANKHYDEMNEEMERRFDKKLVEPLEALWQRLSPETRKRLSKGTGF